jgi:hypothetical protein
MMPNKTLEPAQLFIKTSWRGIWEPGEVFKPVMKLCHYPEQFAQEALGYNSKAVHIGVVVLVIMHQRVNHPTRFLGRRGIVEINQRLAMDFLIQNRKILAQRRPVNCFRSTHSK